MFQFHSGSIKRKSPGADIPRDAKFQFHSGSIKSRDIPSLSVRWSRVSIP